jgi:hypothetical protein
VTKKELLKSSRLKSRGWKRRFRILMYSFPINKKGLSLKKLRISNSLERSMKNILKARVKDRK